MTSLLSHQARVWCNGNEHNHYVYINTTTCVEARMRQSSACSSTSQGPARPECGRRKHKTQFVPLPQKSGSFSSFSGIREEMQFSGIFPENPVGLVSMLVQCIHVPHIQLLLTLWYCAMSPTASYVHFHHYYTSHWGKRCSLGSSH